MVMTSSRLVVLSLGSASLLGCRCDLQPTPTAASAAAPSVASAAPTARAADPARWCEEVRRASQTAVDAAAARAKQEHPGEVTKPFVLPEWCVGGPRARWALMVTGASYGPSVSGPWELGLDIEIAALVDGREARSGWTVGSGGTAPDAIRKLEVVDFDGDGVPELTGIYAPDHPEGVTVERRWFYRWNKGGIGAYEFPGDTWTDADADGRMDGVSAAAVPEHTAWWREVDFRRVPLLSHQKSDGTFSTDDAVARAFARRACPAPPRELMVKGRDGAIDEGESSFHIECARLWGVKMEDVKRAIAGTCPRAPTDEDLREGKPREDTCYFSHVLLRIAEETGPLLATGDHP